MLSYAVRQMNCGCGIVISASHNSGEYNGVKCYGPDGCQMTDEPASIVIAQIEHIPYFAPETKTFEDYLHNVVFIPRSGFVIGLGSQVFREQDKWGQTQRIG